MKKVILFFAFVWCIASLKAQPLIEWQYPFGGSGEEEMNAIALASDGNYLIGGYSSSNNFDIAEHVGYNDCWILKLDPEGQILWQKTFGGSEDDRVLSLAATPDGGCIAGCTFFSSNSLYSGTTSNMIMKLNALGNIQWQQFVPFYISKVKMMSSGNCLVLGTKYLDSTVRNPVIALFSANGEKLWEKTIERPETSLLSDVLETPDGGLLLVGAYKNIYVDADWWMLKLNSNLEQAWEKIIVGNQIDMANKITPITGGGYLVAGTSTSYGQQFFGAHGDADIWVMKISETGNIIWKRNFGGSDEETLNHIAETSDGGFLVLGYTRSSDSDVSYNYGYGDFWLLKISSTGSLLWESSYGGNGTDAAFDGLLDGENTFIMAGSTYSNNGDVIGVHGGFKDSWVVKVTGL